MRRQAVVADVTTRIHYKRAAMGTPGHSSPRKLLPLWAAKHAALVERCRVDLDFRLRVLSATPREREELVHEAEATAGSNP